MRELKCRGKRINNGERVEGYFFQIWERTYILWGTTNGVPNMKEVIPKTVKIEVCGQWFDEKELADVVKKGLTSVSE